jgi:TetR/AcrR family transcriptional regulator, lmrAB and yxaGH operons repressor
VSARGSTKAELLRCARELFRRQGYHGTGLNQILAESGSPKGVLYFHFPGGKQQLAAEAVASSSGEFHAAIASILAANADPVTAVRAIADLLASRLEHSEFRDGCPIAAVALDNNSDVVRQACHAGYDLWLASITDYLSTSGRAPDDAAETALFVLSTLEGALLIARTQQNAAVVRQVAERIATAIGRAQSR